jgi:hypothetical protein
MTVYVLASGRYDDYGVDGVFATAGLAMAAVPGATWEHRPAYEHVPEHWVSRPTGADVTPYEVQGFNG